MNLSTSAQATLLLTSYFSRGGRLDAKPLTNAEWGRFAFWLKDRGMTPGALLAHAPDEALDGWCDERVDSQRIAQLLGRGHALALAVEKWERAGLWVLTRSDMGYPKLLKQRLKAACPPALYGCGDQALLNRGGLAIVGSRDGNDADVAFTCELGAKAAAERVAIVSGGARGVDEAAMLGSLDAGGVVIGVLANRLLAEATSAKWRKGLMRGSVVLASPFYPEAGFSAGNAMARNKYIYCLADAAVVVCSGQTGGTINGARENLKHGWVPLWVKPAVDGQAANGLLVEEGGRWSADSVAQITVADLIARGSCDSTTADGATAVRESNPAGSVASGQEDLFPPPSTKVVSDAGPQ